MSEELKPCPFCESEAELLKDSSVVECSQHFHDALSIEEWNTRPIEDKLRAELKESRDLHDKTINANITLCAENKKLTDLGENLPSYLHQLVRSDNDRLNKENERLKERVKILDEWERDLKESGK